MKVNYRLIVPVILSFTLAFGIFFPMPTADAEAGTPNTAAASLPEEGYSGMSPVFYENIEFYAAPAANPSDLPDGFPHGSPPATISIRVDSKEVTFSSPPLLTNATTYVPLYDFCALMGQASMEQDDISTVFVNGLQIVAAPDSCYISANGRYLYTPNLCKVIDDEVFVPIRPLAKIFGAIVLWDSASRTVSVLTDYTAFEHGDAFYNETDLYWMSRIISAEARGECMEGKIAVGNVVMNRLNSTIYPNSVRGVIFDNSCGVQFTPAYSGAINHTPNQECVIAAKLALEGANVVGNSLFFNVARLRSWASRNRTFVTTIGNHSFFA